MMQTSIFLFLKGRKISHCASCWAGMRSAWRAWLGSVLLPWDCLPFCIAIMHSPVFPWSLRVLLYKTSHFRWVSTGWLARASLFSLSPLSVRRKVYLRTVRRGRGVVGKGSSRTCTLVSAFPELGPGFSVGPLGLIR